MTERLGRLAKSRLAVLRMSALQRRLPLLTDRCMSSTRHCRRLGFNRLPVLAGSAGAKCSETRCQSNPVCSPVSESRKQSMAKTYAELNREIESLKVQAEAARQKEKAGVVERIRDAIAVYGLTAEELGFGRPAIKTAAFNASDSTSSGKVRTADKATSIKYLDASGNTWGGRGPKPNWLKAGLAKGRSLESFATDGSAAAEVPAVEEGPAGARAKPRAKNGPQAKKAFKSVVKYRDNDGHTWSGRGPKPTWFTSAIESGKTPDQLAV